MKKEDMLKLVQEQITTGRYEHTLGVVQSAVKLAQRFSPNDLEKAEVAAIFHDYAKFRDKHEMARIIEEQDEIPDDLLQYHHELWHAPVGAYLVQTEVGIADIVVLDAIRFHTTGRVNMTIVEKIVCLADYIEPGRRFPGVDEVREQAETNLDQALAQALGNTIGFLESKGQKVYPLTIAAYNDLTK
ncbi:bis(5'-nucleosyl)-tetraphosphatase (symmetrical) YqeK [Caldalkalibacillus salinus]|uniref:bis(5'-nucleosyl)-tetraphosphatase (symmetrical) YqeK n=1 Tax=Caldalkalibacillus salinus TaxID=2803787 RepID=UPI001924FE95|nr:bis(5'-nucleosyl)-tetraphosphatase (symmetrical) YqeK [Caldalkalibacillus salinus]